MTTDGGGQAKEYARLYKILKVAEKQLHIAEKQRDHAYHELCREGAILMELLKDENLVIFDIDGCTAVMVSRRNGISVETLYPVSVRPDTPKETA